MLQEEGWVVCRVFKKRLTTVRKMDEHEPVCNWYDGQVSFLPDFKSPRQITHDPYTPFFNHQYSSKQELDQLQHFRPHERYYQLPQLVIRPEDQDSAASVSCKSVFPYGFEHSSIITQENKLQHSNQALHPKELYGGHSVSSNNNFLEQAVDQVTDWQVLDEFVASQFGQDNQDSASNKETRCSNDQLLEHMLCNDLRRPDPVGFESTTISTVSCQIDPWK